MKGEIFVIMIIFCGNMKIILNSDKIDGNYLLLQINDYVYTHFCLISFLIKKDVIFSLEYPLV